jgi:hypothetical protein
MRFSGVSIDGDRGRRVLMRHGEVMPLIPDPGETDFRTKIAAVVQGFSEESIGAAEKTMVEIRFRQSVPRFDIFRIRGNSRCQLSQFRIRIQHFLPSLVCLDGAFLRNSIDGSHVIGKGEGRLLYGSSATRRGELSDAEYN